MGKYANSPGPCQWPSFSPFPVHPPPGPPVIKAAKVVPRPPPPPPRVRITGFVSFNITCPPMPQHNGHLRAAAQPALQPVHVCGAQADLHKNESYTCSTMMPKGKQAPHHLPPASQLCLHTNTMLPNRSSTATLSPAQAHVPLIRTNKHHQT